mmetsp:Transcript_24244/g.50803  ORF Transcript_24244/g.50803 Transcript_24244/m.50803 type:complete len:197 (+) Transcript_24244:100-690(+)
MAAAVKNSEKQEDKIAWWQLLRRIRTVRRNHRLRKIQHNDAKLLLQLQQISDDSLTNIETLPTTLSEALPSDDDREDRAKEDDGDGANNQHAIVVTECTGTFNMIGCNKAWENLCGYTESEIIGKDSSILQGPDTNYIGLHDAVQRLFEEEKPVRCITTNYRKDGSKFKNLLTLGPIRDTKGTMTHCVALLKDIGK